MHEMKTSTRSQKADK